MFYNKLKRLFDFLFSIFLLFIFSPLFLIVYLLVILTSRGSGLYWSDRIGINNKVFKMPKFRTMKIDTPIVATHLLKSGSCHLTPIGSFLRKSSLDELPQLLSIVKGEMSFVGPRPALFNQYDLIQMRTHKNIHQIKPGLTGHAQIMGRDELSLEKKVEYDLYYLQNKSACFDFWLLIKTFKKVLMRDGIRH